MALSPNLCVPDEWDRLPQLKVRDFRLDLERNCLFLDGHQINALRPDRIGSGFTRARISRGKAQAFAIIRNFC